MAEKTKIQDTPGSGFGQYDSSRGGGTPVSGGRGAWTKQGQPGHRDDDQPRTKDGKFTYNSANGKPLAETSDPTRGKTVNPLLTRGENGIMIEDVQSQFSSKKGDYWDKYKDTWYVNGSESTGLNTRGKIGIKVAAETIWEVARHSYDSVKGEFQGESENWSSKAGAHSKEEKAAIQKHKQTGKEQFVENQNDNSIKRKDEKAPISSSNIKPTWKKKPSPTIPGPVPQPQPQPTTGSVPTTDAITPAAGTVNQGNVGQSKYSADQLQAAKDFFMHGGVDVSGLTVKELDDAIDMYLDFGEEDSDTTKKIKDMGFDDNDKK